MNTEWALQQLNDFIKQTEMRYPPPTPGFLDMTGHKITAASDDDIIKSAQIVEQILDRLMPTWRDLKVRMSVNKWMRHREASIRGREMLLRQQEIKENLGENAPDISAAKLHPWVWGGAQSLWHSGHFREAVEAALKKLNAETQNKIGRRDISETDLFKQAFSLDPPSSGKPRLRLKDQSSGKKTFESVHRGIMSYAEGIFSGIRNPLAHESDQELTEQEALEYLAALSVLARWADQASIEH